MNFAELQQTIQDYDEVLTIGKNAYISARGEDGNGEPKGTRCYIAGMDREGNQAHLYILTENAADKNRPAVCGGTNRERMKIHTEPDVLMEIAAVKVGETEFITKGITGYPPGQGIPSNEGILSDERIPSNEGILSDERIPSDECIHFAEGIHLDECGFLAGKSREELWVTRIDFELAGNADGKSSANVADAMDGQKTEDVRETVKLCGSDCKMLPSWEGQEISVRLGKGCRSFLVEKPVRLRPGEEAEIPFSLEDGRNGICYVNRVYPIDVWRENEERFKDPRYLEIVSEEELEKQKKEFFEGLEQDCPRGMCYLGIEYECTLDGNLTFYDKAFLDGEPVEHKGSARIMMMLLRPDEPLGKHGLRQHGCVIQTPVLPEIREIEAELFFYMEMLDEEEMKVNFDEE